MGVEMKQHLHKYLLILLIIILSCSPDLPKILSVTKVFELNGNIYETDLDYPYLYVAADIEGFWRIDLSSSDFTSIELPLLDSNNTQANYIDASGSSVVALTKYNIWRSNDFGDTWMKSDSGINIVTHPSAFSRSPFDPSRLFLVNRDGYMYYSSDWGVSWKKGMESGANGYYNSYWDPYRQGDIWLDGMGCIGIQFVMCVENYGASVKEVNVPQYSEIVWFTSMWFDATSIYMRTIDSNGRYIMKSDDGGYTWYEMTTGIPDTLMIYSIFQNPAETGTLYLTDYFNDIIYCSTDSLNSIFELACFEFENEHEYIYKIIYDEVTNSLVVITYYSVYMVKLDD